MANTAIGLAVILGPVCLAVVVLLLIEMTDRIPFPEAGASSRTRPSTSRRREREETMDSAPHFPASAQDRAEANRQAQPVESGGSRARLRRIK